ncbi:XPG domain-containing protein [Paraphaeosphaeria sporulosa]
MIRDFQTWNNTIGEASQLEDLRGLRVGIEAAHYLDHRLLNRKSISEPLVPALGGLPLGFWLHIEEDLDKFATLQIEPFFVFSGLDIAKQDDPFRARQEGAAVNANAWHLYDSHEAEKSVHKFGQSPYVTPEDLFGALQTVLTKKKIPFMVAPYSAWAQLSYLEREEKVQAISGSSEVLLFDCDRVITSWDLEEGVFKWIKRGKCVADLRKYVQNADIADDTFVDACLLAGSHFLPTLPNLDGPNNRNKVSKISGAIEMIMSQGRSGHAVVMNNRDDPIFQRTNYVDRYRKARLAVKHHPILTTDGKIQPLLEGQLPNDSYEFIGQRLPDEVYYYMSRGLINSRVLSWRAASEIVEAPPIDGGDGVAYQDLVSTKLTPLRTTAINLLSSSLHNWYQHKDIDLKCWFRVDQTGKHQATTISMNGLPEWRKSVDTWNVKEATFKDVVSKYKPAGHLGSAILALQDSDFVTKSVSKKDVNNPLSTTDEILYNSIWRFLALREYIDNNHNLTAWGKVLKTAIAALQGKSELEEATVVAIELIRQGVLNWELDMFPYNGAPMRGETRDRQFNLLVSRVAGLGNLRHKAIGFTGPLSQHLLAYGSIVNLVRQTLRDLVEVAATHMFMGAFAKRDLTNLSEIAMNLPFLLSNNCALSIAVKSYLDELYTDKDPTATETKERVRETAANRYFPQATDLVGDLHTAGELWDAVYDGVKSSGSALKESEKKQWAEANEWFAARR